MVALCGHVLHIKRVHKEEDLMSSLITVNGLIYLITLFFVGFPIILFQAGLITGLIQKSTAMFCLQMLPIMVSVVTCGLVGGYRRFGGISSG
jgi:hypothetical protein